MPQIMSQANKITKVLDLYVPHSYCRQTENVSLVFIRKFLFGQMTICVKKHTRLKIDDLLFLKHSKP